MFQVFACWITQEINSLATKQINSLARILFSPFFLPISPHLAWIFKVFIEAMSRKFSTIKEIQGKKESWKLAVRVTEIWHVERGKHSSLDMIFMDAKGDKIWASADFYKIEKWKPVLRQGKTYVVQNFKPEVATGSYRPYDHKYKLNFTNGTVVDEEVLPEIPEQVYHFTEFPEIMNGKASHDILVDIIGVLYEVRFKKFHGHPHVVDFIISDHSGTQLPCTLWDQHADQFLDFLKNHERNVGTEPNIIVLTLLRIKAPKDGYDLSVSNSKYATRVLINPDIQQVADFRKRLDPNMIIPFNNQKSQQLSQEACSQSYISSLSQPDTETRFVKSAKIMSLWQLPLLENDTFCVSVATIESISTNNGWFYTSCSRCKKSAEGLALPFQCDGCNNDICDTVLRYKVEVAITYDGKDSTFVLWDRECLQLVGQTAAELRKRQVEEGDKHRKSIPEPLDCILDKKYAFRFKYCPQYKQGSVLQISQDEELIQSISAKLMSPEGLNVDDKGKGMLDDALYLESTKSQSYSMSAEYDPHLGSTTTPFRKMSNEATLGHTFEDLTPAKRLLSQKISFDDLEDHLTPCQFSSTKHIKSE